MYRVLKAGTGPTVQKNSDVVTVYYKGALITGKVFDQTQPEEPRQFLAGGLIPGWVEAPEADEDRRHLGDRGARRPGLWRRRHGQCHSARPGFGLFTMNLVKVEYAP